MSKEENPFSFRAPGAPEEEEEIKERYDNTHILVEFQMPETGKKTPVQKCIEALSEVKEVLDECPKEVDKAKLNKLAENLEKAEGKKDVLKAIQIRDSVSEKAPWTKKVRAKLDRFLKENLLD